jgi:hypothetical protein
MNNEIILLHFYSIKERKTLYLFSSEKSLKAFFALHFQQMFFSTLLSLKSIGLNVIVHLTFMANEKVNLALN